MADQCILQCIPYDPKGWLLECMNIVSSACSKSACTYMPGFPIAMLEEGETGGVHLQ